MVSYSVLKLIVLYFAAQSYVLYGGYKLKTVIFLVQKTNPY